MSDYMLATFDYPVVLVTVIVVFLCSRVVVYFSKLRDVGHVRSITTLFSPYSLPGPFLPHSWWNAGLLFTWWRRRTLYQGNRSRTVSVVPLLYGKHVLVTGSIEVMRQVTATKAPFDKGEFGTQGQSLSARNLVSSFGDEWLRHRKIVTPAFSQQLHQQVWAESLRLYRDMTAAEGWDVQDTVSLPNIMPLTAKFTMFVVTTTGFGLPLPWKDPPRVAEDMTLWQAFHTLSTNIQISLYTPEWAFSAPFKVLQETKRARDIIVATMREIIATGRSQRSYGGETQSKDILNLLLTANEAEGSKTALTDEELMSNAFILLLAGHHTSAKTLGITLGLLACHPEEQERLHDAITSVLPDGREPDFDDFDLLRPVQACILESLRLIPVTPLLLRETMQDNAILRPGKDEEPIVVAKGVEVVLDIIGIHYNPEYHHDPEAFLPSRWSDKPDLFSGDYLVFGSGPRACIGRKFAMYEMTSWLALFLREWKVEVDSRPGEDRETWRKRVLEDSVSLALTMGPTVIPLKLKRRK